ncbi:RIO1 family-domain-containing protein [Microdochium trichocladiopsis]|uniref:Serine/threonine-protein kinase RIO1 n=1 Tax=Microdochium trichocladiopsis TaxID=1682393 RepID=A0A9P8YFX8_9PEZI|nr:RIO1 family-domain-containing protein [Microdochium trichocladiopsis]KAH7038256.1 RIO1 family-domain-containing protein [Microdochium trichocladiopsis]
MPAQTFEAEDNDFDDIFEDDNDDYDDDGDDDDISKNYNRQRPNQQPTTAQKPSANTFKSVDDQISALSKHAAKIRLDDVKASQERDKDKADRATSDQVLDQRTRMILLQMINRGVVSEIHGAISTGKEANVYGAIALAEDLDSPPIHRAVKVYKTAILSFKDRERYITGEHRFKSGADKGNSRKMVKLWAEKEFRNLRRIHAAGIPCPEPIQLKLHVLVMDFLGDKKGYAYPRLRDAPISSSSSSDDADATWRLLYVQLLGIMRRLYQVCRLVHADLSEYNILYHKKQLYVIDVSQSVEHDHPRSLEFLRMDIKNTGDFFRRQGVDTLPDRTIFDFITRSAQDGGLPVEEPALGEAVERLYQARQDAAGEDETDAAASANRDEVDNEVFRNQFIPQTLEQVYDIEKDAQTIGQGGGDKLVYRNLLADQVVKQQQQDGEKKKSPVSGSEDDESGEGGASLNGDEDEAEDDSDEDEDGDESRFDKGQPRGKKHQDKEEKKAHKAAVKEEKREKRKDKMPKHLKKKLVNSTSRRKN